MALTPKSGTPKIAAGTGGDETTLGIIGAAIAVTGWGLGSVLAKRVGLEGLATASYRFGIFVVISIVWRIARRQSMSVNDFRYGFWGGVALGSDVALFFSAIKLTSVLNAAVIGSLQPVIVSAYAWKFLGERFRVRDMVLSALALVGVILVVTAAGGSGEGDWRGDLMAAGALLSWSAYFIIAKQVKGKVEPTNFTMVTAVITTAICAPLALMFGQSLAAPAAIDWLWLSIMAFGAGVIGHNVMNWSLIRIPLWLGSTMTLLITPVSAVLAWFIVDESVAPLQWLGIVLVLVALTTLILGQIDSAA